MLEHTKKRRTRGSRKKAKAAQKKVRKSIPWREVAKGNIKKYTESGLALRGARFKAELTQRELAVAIGVLPHHISEMEHGKRTIGKEMAHRLAKALDVNYKVFL